MALRHLVFAVFAVVVQKLDVDALLVSEPCCFTFFHQISNIGPALPTQANPGAASASGKLVETDNLCATTSSNLNSSIALVPRGGCKFISKILNAQSAGAAAVVIFETNPSFPDALLTMDADDDSSVSIPSAFVSFNTYFELTDLMNETDVYVVLNATGAVGIKYLLYDYWLFVILVGSFTLLLCTTSCIVLVMGCGSGKVKHTEVVATGPVQGDTLAGSIMLAEESEEKLGKGPVASSNPRYNP